MHHQTMSYRNSGVDTQHRGHWLPVVQEWHRLVGHERDGTVGHGVSVDPDALPSRVLEVGEPLGPKWICINALLWAFLYSGK